MFSAGLQAPYRDFGVQGYQNCRGYVQHGTASKNKKKIVLIQVIHAVETLIEKYWGKIKPEQ